MATVVEHKKSGQRYVLVGTGFGAMHSMKAHWFFGDVMPDEQSGTLPMIAVCNEVGSVGWFPSHELVVVLVDGQTPSELVSL